MTHPVWPRGRVIILAGLLGLAGPAMAITVLDPANLMQNTLTAMRTLEMLDKQAKQIKNEVQMLKYQQRHLEKLPSDVSGQLRTTLSSTANILARAQGLAFDVDRLDQEFARLYPERYTNAVSSNQLNQEARRRLQHARHGLQTALQVQAQVAQNLAGDAATLTDLVAKSQSAIGALQAVQATNQLLALQAAQSIQAQQIQLSQNRAAALELARQGAAAARGREMTRRFLGTGTPYTPHPVRFYGR